MLSNLNESGNTWLVLNHLSSGMSLQTGPTCPSWRHGDEKGANHSEVERGIWNKLRGGSPVMRRAAAFMEGKVNWIHCMDS